MLSFVLRRAAPVGTAVLLVVTAGSVLAAEPSKTVKAKSDALSAAGLDLPALDDAQMDDARGGAGPFGLPDGSFTFAQIGGQTKSGSQSGSPSASTTVFALGGTSLAGAASIGAGGDFNFVSGTTWSQSLTAVTSHTLLP